MMTYDYHGGWSNTAGHNSPLYPYDGEEGGAASLDTTFKYLISKGVSPQKITLGIGSYGRGVITKEAAKLNGTTVKQNMTIQPDGPISTSADYTNWGNFDGSPYYNFIQKNISGWSDNWDDQAKVPYLTKDKFFLSYDNERSIEEKANYVKQNNAGGVIVWTVFGGLKPGNVINVYGSKLPHAPETKDPLINTLNRVFANGSTINTPPIIKGCNNVQILIGSVFDSKKGVTAIDKEDGDISSKIKIEGTVDTQKIGTYTLTYSVVDLGNLTTKVIRTVQVIAAQSPSIDFEKPVNNSTIFINLGDTVPIKLKITDPSSLLTDIKIAVDGKDFSGIIANWIPSKFGTYVITGSANNKDAVIKSQITVIISQKSTSDCNGIPAWDSSKTYSINETQVSYKGNIYKNQWWTSGETPGVAAVWKFVNYCTGGGPDLTETCGYEKWSSDKTYENPGINIYYNEKIYKNQWWTSGETPGINAVWVFVKNCVTPNSSNMQENTSVKIHPNPVNDFITIVTDKNILEVGVYELSSIKVKSFKGNKVIDVHNLKQGYYILKITFNDNSNQSINFYKK
jgi:chitinase